MEFHAVFQEEKQDKGTKERGTEASLTVGLETISSQRLRLVMGVRGNKIRVNRV